MALLGAGLLASIGLGLVVGVQLAIAQIATAENTAEMLQVMKQDRARSAPGGPQRSSMSRALDAEVAQSGAQGMSATGLQRVKTYKGHLIERRADGSIVVGDEAFSGILSAEKHINDLVAKE